MKSHRIFKHVYYDDTDGGGVVYHANYLRYLDHARSDYLARHGFSLHTLQYEYGVFFAVTRMDLRFQKPARLSDELEITATLENFSASRLSFQQTVCRTDTENHNRDCLLSAEVTVACLDSTRFKPVRLPVAIREALARVD